MKQCFGYVRVSTVKQGEGVSLEAQKDAILAFAAQNNITIKKWYEEKQTAAKSGRPVFSDMIKALRAHKAEGVVMHKIDRSARNFRDWARVGELSDAGIDVHFAAESLDFRSRGGRLSADIQAVIAADYIRNLREEVRKGVIGQLQRGLYPLKAPIGYVDNGGGNPKTLHPEKASLVKQAFELYASGQYSLRSLCEEMNRRGLRNQNGSPISKSCLEKCFVNPFYTGVIHVKTTGESYRGIHEPLISGSLFDAVQGVKANRGKKKKTQHNHTYRGLFKCKQCGQSMIPERQKGYVYYRCQVSECPTNSIREEQLEQAIKSVLQRVTFSDDDIEAITAAVEEWVAEDSSAYQKASYTLQLEKLQHRLERLTDALVDNLIDEQTFKGRKKQLLLQQSDLEQKLKDQHKTEINPHMVKRFLERVKNLAEHYIFADPEEKREIAEITTSNRRVSNKNVYIEPSKCLQTAQQSLTVFCCAQSRPTSRRRTDFRNQQIQELIELSCSGMADEFEAVFADKDEPQTMKR